MTTEPRLIPPTLASVSFTVYGDAEPAGSKRQVPVRRKVNGQWVPTGRVLVIDANPKAKDWQDRVAKIAGETMAGQNLLLGPVELQVTFYRARPRSHYGTGKNIGRLRDNLPIYPTTKPDATKLLRGVEDALTSVVWRDDAQVCVQRTEKRYGEPARIEVTIREL